MTTRTTVVESPPTTPGRPPSRRIGDAAALVFRRRVRLIDWAARALISVSGWTIIAAVLGIGFFLIFEILPLVAGARVAPGGSIQALPHTEAYLAMVDEHQERALVVGPAPTAQVLSLRPDGEAAEALVLAGLEGRTISAASRALLQADTAIATTTGEVWLGRIQFVTRFDGSTRRVSLELEPAAVIDAAPGHAITQLAYRKTPSGGVIAAVADDVQIIVTRITETTPLIGPARRTLESLAVPLDGLGTPTGVLVDEPGSQLLVGTSDGMLARWRLGPDGAELLESIEVVPGGAVTALSYLLGDRSIAVGGSDGSVATWSLVRHEGAPDGWRTARIHEFPSHPDQVVSIAPSPRDKGFLTASVDGLARLHYMTVERTLAEFQIGAVPAAADFAPKANGAVYAGADGTLRRWTIDNPHPEVSWKALFGKIWYEGYKRPEYIWQSTGGTDDFEPKFSLVPLVFGTLKGTLYALLFAVPFALFGALYCSQFLPKRLRSPVKSTVELMAALPSVVLGFLAGVVLSPLVQRHIVSVLMAPAVIPVVALGGMVMMHQASPGPIQRRIAAHEFPALIAWVLAGVLAAWWLGPVIERFWFGGDFEAWLLQATGTRYDQRNALVVGWIMGFAVIPIIFTICEDAFSAVPRHLVGASLACGASAWQTARRVVLPAAGSGVFSAVMIGFGRAVGETMIVLMATGNTPVMEWSVFNGFRALSANIAVEIPEAPHGATLYRVLFVAALLLFAITFVVNTLAELIRLRLRHRLRGL
jgi:phosphate transport system permease protein